MAKLYPYTLTEIMIAAYTRDTDVYGTPIALEADHQFTVEPQADTDQMRDSGQITRALTVVTSANVTIGAGGVDFDELVILEGAVKTTYVQGGGNVIAAQTAAGGAGLPYFGAIGRAATDAGEVAVVGIRCMKLNAPLKKQFDGTANKFMVNEAQGIALAISNLVDVWKYYEDDDHWTTLRPDNAAKFKDFFVSLGT
jgi:hypothetical protein